MPLPHKPFQEPLAADTSPTMTLSPLGTRRSLLAALGAATLSGCVVAPPPVTGPRQPGPGVRPLPVPAPGSGHRYPPPTGVEEVPYVQTPQPVVDAMLSLAQVRPGDRLLDLGSGDGRVVITAARQFGVPGLGVEIDPSLVRLSEQRAREMAVSHLARFSTQDLFQTDLSQATVIMMYLLPDVNLALRPRLLSLAPGTRIVSHDWDMNDWRPDRSVTVAAPGKPVGRLKESTLHLWIVPAQIEGGWRGRFDDGGGGGIGLRVSQRFQMLTVEWRIEGTYLPGVPPQGRADSKMDGGQAVVALPGQARLFLRSVNGLLSGEITTPEMRRRWQAVRA